MKISCKLIILFSVNQHKWGGVGVGWNGNGSHVVFICSLISFDSKFLGSKLFNFSKNILYKENIMYTTNHSSFSKSTSMGGGSGGLHLLTEILRPKVRGFGTWRLKAAEDFLLNWAIVHGGSKSFRNIFYEYQLWVLFHLFAYFHHCSNYVIYLHLIAVVVN